MRLHVYDIEDKILRALSSKPIRSRQVALYANQVLICKFIQRLSGKENLAMKKREQNIKSVIPYSSTLAHREAIVAKTTYFTNQRPISAK